MRLVHPGFLLHEHLVVKRDTVFLSLYLHPLRLELVAMDELSDEVLLLLDLGSVCLC